MAAADVLIHVSPPPPTPPAQSFQIESKKQFTDTDDKQGIKLIQTQTKLIWLDM